MTPDKIILLIIDKAGGRISGKTLLQKRAYFLSKALHWDLGYRAHYYGPYSPEIETGIGRLKSLGFIDEKTLGFGTTNQSGFEVRRYDYEITEDGKTIIQKLRQKESSACQKVDETLCRLSEAGDDGDYMTLSIAAKTYHVLDEKRTPLKNEEIRNFAKTLGWKISPESIDNAVNFLEKVELVTAG